MKSKFVFPALLVLFGLLSGIILAETLLYIFYFKEESQKFYVWRPDTRQLFRPLPDVLPGISGEGLFLVNREGMRGDAYDGDYQVRILAIGGSTTECLYLDQAESWPQIVQQQLRKKAGDSNSGADNSAAVFVGNIGKSGLTSREHLFQVEYLLRQYPDIDVVLLLLGVNDMSLALSDPDYKAFDPASQQQRNRVLERAFSIIPQDIIDDPEEDVFYKKTALANLLKKAKRRFKKKDDLVMDDAGLWIAERQQLRQNAGKIIDVMPDLSAGLSEYEKNINAIADLSRDYGVRLVLMTQPYIWRDDLPQEMRDRLWFGGQDNFTSGEPRSYYSVGVLAEAMALYNSKLLQICSERDLDCIDLAGMLPQDDTVYYDDVHFNESGARQVADEVTPVLADLIWQ